jgi:hypothetical protein
LENVKVNNENQPSDNGGQLKIVPYKVIIAICANNDEPLSDQVNRAIADGWRPQGGVSVMHHPSIGTIFSQAMVKYEKTTHKWYTKLCRAFDAMREIEK